MSSTLEIPLNCATDPPAAPFFGGAAPSHMRGGSEGVIVEELDSQKFEHMLRENCFRRKWHLFRGGLGVRRKRSLSDTSLIATLSSSSDLKAQASSALVFTRDNLVLAIVPEILLLMPPSLEKPNPILCEAVRAS